ncbi:hypothetical protein F5141DRAFT_1066809 [Pisolithus sp. B1]|nr:hypothetical protein F5141DRAFT_1066809 [Pisolithus sp. B1]
MPHVCKECGLELGNKNAHWKKCVSIVTFVAYTGQDVTITCHENGTFLCYCSHHKCPRDIGFTTADALHKHMKTLKTTWLGLEKKASEQSSVQAVNATAVPMEITTNTPPPQMPAAIPQNKTMMTPLAASNDVWSSGGVSHGIAPCPKSQVSSGHGRAIPHGVRVELHFIHHPYLDSINLVVNAEFCILACQVCKKGIDAPSGQAHLVNKHPEFLPSFDQEHYNDIMSQLRVAASLPTISGPRSVVHGLALFDALACNFCTTVYTKHKNMREHHGKKHPDMPIPQNWQSCKAQNIKVEGVGMSSTAEEEHYKMLPESIQLYFEEALALIDTTDELVLQQLNSPDPAKE